MRILIVFSIGLLMLVAPTLGLAQPEALPYSTSFETGFNLGDLGGQDGWTVVGTASIQDSVFHSGEWALEQKPNTKVDKTFDGSSGSIVWLQAQVKNENLDSGSAPDLDSMGTGSSLLYFSSTEGIFCLDGDGNNGGTWVNADVDLISSAWHSITIRQDYDEQTWNCYVDGALKLSDLGFKNMITQFNGFKSVTNAATTSYLDDFIVGHDPLYSPGDLIDLFLLASMWEKESTPESETDFQRFDLDDDNTIDSNDLLIFIGSGN